jgi:hypothetical protein
MEFKRVYPCGAVHPVSEIECEIRSETEGQTHDGRHYYTVWFRGNPSYPVYWGENISAEFSDPYA